MNSPGTVADKQGAAAETVATTALNIRAYAFAEEDSFIPLE